MRLVTLLLVVGLALPAHADELEPAVVLDASTQLDPSTSLDVVLLEAGAPAPQRGLLVPEAKAIDLAKRIKGCEAEVAVYKTGPAMTPIGIVVSVGAAALVLGLVGGAVLGAALKKP